MSLDCLFGTKKMSNAYVFSTILRGIACIVLSDSKVLSPYWPGLNRALQALIFNVYNALETFQCKANLDSKKGLHITVKPLKEEYGRVQCQDLR